MGTEELFEYEGVSVWDFGGNQWIAARTLAEAKDYYAELCGFTCEDDDVEGERCSLLTEHFRELDNPDLGKCTFLDSLKQHLAAGWGLPWEISICP